LAVDPELIALTQNENPSEADFEKFLGKVADVEAAYPG
jgi:hypothetical protein